MSGIVVLSGLKERYARLLGEQRACETRLRRIKDDLQHLKATIRLFSEECDPEQIAPIEFRSRFVFHGQCARTALDVLRIAREPMTARQIAYAVMARCEIPSDKPDTVKAVTFAVRDALKRKEGHLTRAVDGWPKRWVLTSRDPDASALDRLIASAGAPAQPVE